MIVGSLRKNSFNKQLAAMAEQELGDRASVSVLDWSEVPVFNQDEEFPTPKSVAEARVAVNEADAIWIFTPEYNHSVPGSLKNLFDWLSRPLEDGTPSVLTGKVMTMSGVGGLNTLRYAFAAWMPSLTLFKMRIVPVPFTGVTLNREMFSTDKLELNAAMRTSLKYQPTPRCSDCRGRVAAVGAACFAAGFAEASVSRAADWSGNGMSYGSFRETRHSSCVKGDN